MAIDISFGVVISMGYKIYTVEFLPGLAVVLYPPSRDCGPLGSLTDESDEGGTINRYSILLENEAAYYRISTEYGNFGIYGVVSYPVFAFHLFLLDDKPVYMGCINCLSNIIDMQYLENGSCREVRLYLPSLERTEPSMETFGHGGVVMKYLTFERAFTQTFDLGGYVKFDATPYLKIIGERIEQHYDKVLNEAVKQLSEGS
jgi:hypothetical protein